tara:strand:- start:115 stop:366 length:252 start_codon:yes stop_codon:yes gene_type:complete
MGYVGMAFIWGKEEVSSIEMRSSICMGYIGRRLFGGRRRYHLLKYDPVFVWGALKCSLFGGRKRRSFSVLKCDHALSQFQIGF